MHRNDLTAEGALNAEGENTERNNSDATGFDIIRKKVFTKKPVKLTPKVKFTGNKKALKKRIGFKLKSTLNTSFISYVRKAILRQLRSELAIEINE